MSNQTNSILPKKTLKLNINNIHDSSPKADFKQKFNTFIAQSPIQENKVQIKKYLTPKTIKFQSYSQRNRFMSGDVKQENLNFERNAHIPPIASTRREVQPCNQYKKKNLEDSQEIILKLARNRESHKTNSQKQFTRMVTDSQKNIQKEQLLELLLLSTRELNQKLKLGSVDSKPLIKRSKFPTDFFQPMQCMN